MNDSPVDRVCSRSREALSAGRISPLRSAPGSYPVSSKTGSESKQFRNELSSLFVATLMFLTHTYQSAIKNSSSAEHFKFDVVYFTAHIHSLDTSVF